MTAGHSIADLLAWCASTLGAVEETLDRSKSHPGEPAVTYRLRTGRGYCFAQWDVRAVDFARYPDWDWLSRPDLSDAFFDGYGRSFTTREKRQRLVAHVQYAVSAIV